jgi:hypothetical protein
MPNANWSETEITVMIDVCSTSCHHTGAVSTWP